MKSTDTDRYTWLLANMGLVEEKAMEWRPSKHKPLLQYLHDYISDEAEKAGRCWIERQRALFDDAPF